MKQIGRFLVVLALVAAVSLPAMGSANPSGLSDDQAEEVQSLLTTLRVGDEAQKEQAAYTRGELGSSEAVIPLMRMLHQNESEEGRIVAALALCRIGDPIGSFAVKRAVEFDGSKKVQERCAWFYNEYVKPGSFAFINVPSGNSLTLGSR